MFCHRRPGFPVSDLPSAELLPVIADVGHLINRPLELDGVDRAESRRRTLEGAGGTPRCSGFWVASQKGGGRLSSRPPQVLLNLSTRYEMVILGLKVYEPAKVAVVPPSSLTEHLTFSVCLAWLAVAHEPSACAPLITILNPVQLTVAVKPLSTEASNEALVPATEAVDLRVIVPLVVTVHEDPKRLSVHVLPPKVRVPLRDLPSAAVLPLNVEVGHLTDRPLDVRELSVEVPVTAVLTGVRVAFAGAAATARMLSIAIARSSPRLDADFI